VRVSGGEGGDWLERATGGDGASGDAPSPSPGRGRPSSTCSPLSPILLGIFWATSVAGTLALEARKPIPTSLRIIHARVYAQAFTLAALGMAALEASTRESGAPKKEERSGLEYRP